MQQIRTFEQLQACLIDDRELLKKTFVNKLRELTPLERGRSQGEIIAYSDMIEILHNIIKYNDN